MSGKTNTLMDAVLAAYEGQEVALYTVAPTQTSAGTEVADSDYQRATLSLGAASDGSIAGTRKALNDLVLEFGTAGAAVGYTIAAIAIVDGSGNPELWAPYTQAIAVGEIPRIPVSELTVVEG